MTPLYNGRPLYKTHDPAALRFTQKSADRGTRRYHVIRGFHYLGIVKPAEDGAGWIAHAYDPGAPLGPFPSRAAAARALAARRCG